ncbi:MAG: DNA-3-methyladenine glycosylase 2 family protein [Acidimicrobiia bacterium]|nr:DNA-3-methyladenine glycosylase 2 family protein [Acidimicrobiia bacterium]
MGWAVARRLTAELLREGCDALRTADANLARLLDRNGMPPLRLRPAGFATLVHLILQQQVSLASAQAVYGRLESLLGEVSPGSFLKAEHDALRGAGFSHQKIEYVTSMAARIEDGQLPLDGLVHMSDDEAIEVLVAERGIGPWTASVYLLTALGRPDVWAPGDRALLVSLGRMLATDDVPANEDAVALAEKWRPWRSVAARILWHDYSAAELR